MSIYSLALPKLLCPYWGSNLGPWGPRSVFVVIVVVFVFLLNWTLALNQLNCTGLVGTIKVSLCRTMTVFKILDQIVCKISVRSKSFNMSCFEGRTGLHETAWRKGSESVQLKKQKKVITPTKMTPPLRCVNSLHTPPWVWMSLIFFLALFMFCWLDILSPLVTTKAQLWFGLLLECPQAFGGGSLYGPPHTYTKGKKNPPA